MKGRWPMGRAGSSALTAPVGVQCSRDWMGPPVLQILLDSGQGSHTRQVVTARDGTSTLFWGGGAPC